MNINKDIKPRIKTDGLVAPIARPSNNFEELVYTGFAAIVHCITVLINTPPNSCQETVEKGFDIRASLLFRESKSQEYIAAVEELRDKIREACNNSLVEVNITRDSTNKIIEIEVKYVVVDKIYKGVISSKYDIGDMLLFTGDTNTINVVS